MAAMPPASVLVVEDDADISSVLAEVLRAEDVQTVLASNGLEALESLATVRRPCLVLLDLMMPIMDGERFLELMALRSDRDDFVVVLMSASSYAVRMKFRHGVVQVLRKPFQLDDLLELVHGLPSAA